jgi:hypothetical protein
VNSHRAAHPTVILGLGQTKSEDDMCVVGYDYRQLTGDTGASLGSFKGRVDAIAPG